MNSLELKLTSRFVKNCSEATRERLLAVAGEQAIFFTG
jgi:hypothetical protein